MADEKITLNPSAVLAGESPLVLTAVLEPVAGLDRFQPAGFPEVGHVIYKAPRSDGTFDDICIVDSAASMANHLESVCMRGPHDFGLVDDLEGMPHLRCVTDAGWPEIKADEPKEVVVTSLTEGHRIASSYFLDGRRMDKGHPAEGKFEDELAKELGIVLKGSGKAHPPAARWWDVFQTIYRRDPNALVHGVLFPQWQIKIPRVLTAHLEAIGASRVDRSGVKFDRLGKTTSGQPIFAVDEAAARQIRATFIIDVALVRSFGRKDGDKQLGVSEKGKAFLVALALWKIERLLASPFRFRSGCHLQRRRLVKGDSEVSIDAKIKEALKACEFANPGPTDIYWPAGDLYREAESVAKKSGENAGADGDDDDGDDSGDE